MTKTKYKFRGRTDDGYWYFGGISDDGKSIIVRGHAVQVIPETVAMRTGLDLDDKEVYEGDILIDELEQEHVAEIYDRPQFIKRLKLRRSRNEIPTTAIAN